MSTPVWIAEVLQGSRPGLLLHGDMRLKLADIPDASLDACVCDPPYGLSKEPDIAEVLTHWLAGKEYVHGSKGMMGTKWDSFVPGPEYWRHVFRVLKPGAHLLAFASSRTWDLMSIAIRMAGFENRDTIAVHGIPACSWTHGEGFPKAGDLAKVLAKSLQCGEDDPRCSPWKGWSGAIKPSWEVVLVFRKPIQETTIARQVLKTGTGALHIDACRVATGVTDDIYAKNPHTMGGFGHADSKLYGSAGPSPVTFTPGKGRYPPNTVFCHLPGCVRVGTARVSSSNPGNKVLEGAATTVHAYGVYATRSSVGHASPDGTEAVDVHDCEQFCPVHILDHQSGERKSGARKEGVRTGLGYHGAEGDGGPAIEASSGGASRFFPMFEWERGEFEEAMAYECEPNCPVHLLDVQSGIRPSQGPKTVVYGTRTPQVVFGMGNPQAVFGTPDPLDADGKRKGFNGRTGPAIGDTGTAARYFPQFAWEPGECEVAFQYVAKASRAERNEGLPADQPNQHISVKPRALMSWLLKLVLPPNGVVLDPFAGSGTTCVAAVKEGFRFIGVELDAASHKTARLRIQHALLKRTPAKP